MQRNCGGGKSKRFLSKIAHLSETKYELWQRERGVNSPNTTSEDHEMLLIVFVFRGDLFRRYQFSGFGILFARLCVVTVLDLWIIIFALKIHFGHENCCVVGRCSDV